MAYLMDIVCLYIYIYNGKDKYIMDIVCSKGNKIYLLSHLNRISLICQTTAVFLLTVDEHIWKQTSTQHDSNSNVK